MELGSKAEPGGSGKPINPCQQLPAELAAVWTEAESTSQLPQAGTNIVTLLDTNPLNKKAFLV